MKIIGRRYAGTKLHIHVVLMRDMGGASCSQAMKRFLREEKGLTNSVWLICLIPGIAMLFVIILASATVNQAYNHASKHLSRTCSVSVGQTERHNTIRDIVTDIPQATYDTALENNLIAAGFVKESGNTWRWQDSYRISNLQMSAGGKLLNFTGTLHVNMPWRLGDIFSVATIQIKGQAHILFIDLTL